ARRIDACLPAAYASAIKSHRKEGIGIPQHIMIEEVLRAGAEMAESQRPPAQAHRQSKLMLLVAIAAQRQKAEALLRGQVENGPGNGQQRRRLIVTPPEATQYPTEVRDSQGRANRGSAAFSLSNPEECVRRRPPFNVNQGV